MIQIVINSDLRKNQWDSIALTYRFKVFSEQWLGIKGPQLCLTSSVVGTAVHRMW